MNKETSSRVSSIAARVLAMEPGTFTGDTYRQLLSDAKTLAGSCLSQDETPGQGPTTFPDRLKRERDELSDRFIALQSFLNRGTPGVSTDQHNLLNCQKDAMSLYLKILNMRLHLIALDEATRTDAKPDVASERSKLGEPKEIIHADEDRDGPVPFDG